MKKQSDKKSKIQIRKGRKTKNTFPLTSRNYQLFGIGILVIVLGYLSLSKGPANSFWSLTLAPILLVIGYCVLIPISILYKEKSHVKTSGD